MSCSASLVSHSSLTLKKRYNYLLVNELSDITRAKYLSVVEWALNEWLLVLCYPFIYLNAFNKFRTFTLFLFRFSQPS